MLLIALTLTLTLVSQCLIWSNDAQGRAICVLDDVMRNRLLAPRDSPPRNMQLPPEWNADYGYAEYSR
jgi:hypothetical protein